MLTRITNKAEAKSEIKVHPIIFVHYGDNEYLRYTLSCTKYFNKNARVILLGDSQNKQYSTLGIEHFFFSDYNQSSEIHRFYRVYKHIAGKGHGKHFWTKFVFERWFYIYEFLKSESIDSFWAFDSDNLILTDLSRQVEKFECYDCTEQCNGMCLNGFISKRAVVKNYIDCINRLFEDTEYLAQLLGEFEEHPSYAFTDMRAYAEYRKRSGIKTIRLNSILENESFDDCLCQPHGMSYKHGRKELIYKKDGIYAKRLSNGSLVKMNSLNMSWLPVSLIEEVFLFSRVNAEARTSLCWQLFVRSKTKLKYWLLSRLTKTIFLLKNI